jgi:hypothetical protein
MSQQFQIIIEKQIMAHCQNSAKVVWHHLFIYWTLEMFRQCNIFLVFYVTLELFQQYGIICFSIGLWNSSDNVA